MAWRQGDAAALDRLVPLVYDEVRRIARRHMRRERDGHTLQASALVNEAYLRLTELTQVQWQNRVHFFALASRIMRRVLVDAARAKAYQKRGAGAQRVTLGDALAVPQSGQDFVALDDALKALERVDHESARSWRCAFSGDWAPRRRRRPLMSPSGPCCATGGWQRPGWRASSAHRLVTIDERTGPDPK